jgi:dipeptidyl-peptidase 4
MRIATLATVAALSACGGNAPAARCPTVPPPDTTRPADVADTPAAPATPPPIDAATIATMSATRGFSLGTPKPVVMLPDGDVLFLRTGPRSFSAELFELDAATGQIAKLVSAADLVAGDVKLSAAEKALRERTRTALRGIVHVEASTDGSRLLIPLGAQVFVFDRATRKTQSVALGEGYPDHTSLSPDGGKVAFVRDQDLWVADVGGKKPRKLTAHEGPAITYGAAEFVAQEELDRTDGYWWSPDGQHLLYQRTDETAVDTLWVSNPSNPADAPTPFRYPRAGATNAELRLAIIAAKGGKSVAVEWDRAAFPYLRHAQWTKHAPPTLVVMNRAQTEARVLAVDPKTGKTTVLVSESDPAWVNVPDGPVWIAEGARFLWATEKSGSWALEIHAADGKLEDTIAIPGFTGDYDVDVEGGEVWAGATSIPTEMHIARVNLASKAVERLPTPPGTHNVYVGPKGGTRVQYSIGADGVRSWQAQRRDGSAIAEIPSVAEDAPAMPTTVLETVTLDGRTHHVAITRPRDFDAARRYPVVLQVYGGPNVSTVWNNPRAYFKDQLLADTGFVVVRSDNRGTPGRGRDWERVISRDLIGIALADQVGALQAVGAAHPELDLERVGVVGWSFGGYFSAMAALLRPDVFKAAIAGAPVTDWRFYDTTYTERYMGMPQENAAAYDAQSAVEQAAKLTRPLMLVHGLTDDNVYVVNTLALAEALLRAGKDFDLVTLGSTHMVVDPAAEAALMTRQIEFFRRHLGLPTAKQ